MTPGSSPATLPAVTYPTDPAPDSRTSLQVPIEGMTCASCANRIEKRLGRLDGVSATVNYATNRALVLAPQGITAGDLVAAVEKAGYGAAVHLPDAPEPAAPSEAIRLRLVVALALAVPVVLMPMLPALQLPGGLWVALALTTPTPTLRERGGRPWRNGE